MRGRKPDPTALKEAKGNPGKRKLSKDEPAPRADTGGPPSWLGPIALKEWKRIVPELRSQGLFTVFDRAALEMYVSHYEMWRVALAAARKRNDPVHPVNIEVRQQALFLHRMLAEFGFTPSSRVRLGISTATAGGGLMAFLSQGAGSEN